MPLRKAHTNRTAKHWNAATGVRFFTVSHFIATHIISKWYILLKLWSISHITIFCVCVLLICVCFTKRHTVPSPSCVRWICWNHFSNLGVSFTILWHFLLSRSRGEAQEYVNKVYVVTLNFCTWYDEKLSLFNISLNLYFKKYFPEVDILNEFLIAL